MMLYHDCQGQAICTSKLTQFSLIKTGVNKGSILSLFLFSLFISWIMKNAAKDERGILWSISNMLSDLDYADDSYPWAYSNTQALAVEIASTAAMLGLGWVGWWVFSCMRAWMVPGTSEASIHAHIYFVPGLAVISFLTTKARLWVTLWTVKSMQWPWSGLEPGLFGSKSWMPTLGLCSSHLINDTKIENYQTKVLYA